MNALGLVRSALREVTAGLEIASGELPAAYDPDVTNASAELAEAAGRAFSSAAGRQAWSLHAAMQQLTAEPSAGKMAAMLKALSQVVATFRREVQRKAEARAWRLAAGLSELAEHLEPFGNPNLNAGFAGITERLMHCPWLDDYLTQSWESLQWKPRSRLTREEFIRAAETDLLEVLERTEAGALAAEIEDLLPSLELRVRQVWLLRHRRAADEDAVITYGMAHSQIFGSLQQEIGPLDMQSKIGRVAGVARLLELPEVGGILETADWLAGFAMQFLMPPAPEDWQVRRVHDLEPLQAGRLSSWHLFPFCGQLTPLQMIAAVLRAGRPLFYEHVVAHAWVEIALLEGRSVVAAGGREYLEIQEALDREFLVLLDGLLLRQYYYPRLKTAQGWCDYLGAAHALHFGGRQAEEFVDYRAAFFARRRLRSGLDILYRSTEASGSVN